MCGISKCGHYFSLVSIVSAPSSRQQREVRIPRLCKFCHQFGCLCLVHARPYISQGHRSHEYMTLGLSLDYLKVSTMSQSQEGTKIFLQRIRRCEPRGEKQDESGAPGDNLGHWIEGTLWHLKIGRLNVVSEVNGAPCRFFYRLTETSG